MNCKQFEAMALDLPGNARAEKVISREAELHVAGCPACMSRLQELRRVRSGLADLRLATASMEAPAYLESRLRAAFREKHRPVITIPARRNFSWAYFAAMATILLIAGVAFLPSRRTPKSPVAKRIVWASKPPMTARVEKPVKIETRRKPPAHGALSAQLATAAKPGVGENKLNGGPVADNNYPEDPQDSVAATPRITAARNVWVQPKIQPDVDFVALQPESDAPPVGDQSIVRVTVPASELRAMGLHVNGYAPEHRVTADVVIDQFGTTHAIRLLPQAKAFKKRSR